MKSIAKQQAALEALLEKRRALDREINELWQELRPLRLAAIRGGGDPGELPHLVGLDEAWRSGQLRAESLAFQNREADEAAARDPVLQGLWRNDAA